MAEFRHRFRVRFDNVDYARVLYFPRQIDFFVEALEEFAHQKLGISFKRMLDVERISWPTVHIEVDYLAPLEYEQEAEVCVRVERIGEKSITFAYDVVRVADQAPTSRGRHIVAMLDMKSGRAIPVPPHLRAKLAPHVVPHPATHVDH